MRVREGILRMEVADLTSRRSAGHALLLVAFAVFLASCDAVTTPDPITLQAKTVAFRFEFDSAGLQPGETVDVQSTESVDMGPLLSNDGFTKGEVLSASVTAVELERISPTSVDLDFLDQAALAFSASGITTRTIASSSALPGSRSAPLTLGSTDVTAFVVAPAFRGVLSVVPDVVPQAGFVLRANVTFRIQVEGV